MSVLTHHNVSLLEEIDVEYIEKCQLPEFNEYLLSLKSLQHLETAQKQIELLIVEEKKDKKGMHLI